MPRPFQLPDGRWINIPDDPKEYARLSSAVSSIMPGTRLPPPMGSLSPFDQPDTGDGNLLGSAWEGIKQIPFGLMDVPLSIAQSAVGAVTPGTDLPVEQWFRDVQAAGRQRVDPTYADAFLPKVGHGLGQVGGMILGGRLGKTVGTTAMVSLGVSDQIRRMAEQEQRTGTPVGPIRQTAAHILGAGVGLTERFGLKSITGMKKFPASWKEISDNFFANQVRGGQLRQTLTKAATSTGREALQESTQQFLAASTAYGLYDPDAMDNIISAMAEDAQVGGVVGGIASLMMDGILRSWGIRPMDGMSSLVEGAIGRQMQVADAEKIAQRESGDPYVLRDNTGVLARLYGREGYLSEGLARFGGLELKDFSGESLEAAVEDQKRAADLAIAEIDSMEDFDAGPNNMSREQLKEAVIDVTNINLSKLSLALRRRDLQAILPFPSTLDMSGTELAMQKRMEALQSLNDEAFTLDDAFGGDATQLLSYDPVKNKLSLSSALDIITADRAGGAYGINGLVSFANMTGIDMDLGLEGAAADMSAQRGVDTEFTPGAISDNAKVTPAEAGEILFGASVLDGKTLDLGPAIVPDVSPDPAPVVEGSELPTAEEVEEMSVQPENLGLKKIISGGQTGADVGGILAARKLGVETGGTARHGYRTDWDRGRVDERRRKLIEWGLEEGPKASKATKGEGNIAGAEYAMRTRLNVENSDGTIAFRPKPSLGTDKTISYAQYGTIAGWNRGLSDLPKGKWSNDNGYRPVLVLESTENTSENRRRIREFIARNGIKTLNIAGPRQGRPGPKGSRLGVDNIQQNVSALIHSAISGDPAVDAVQRAVPGSPPQAVKEVREVIEQQTAQPEPEPVPEFVGELTDAEFDRYVKKMPSAPGITLVVGGSRDYGARDNQEENEREKRSALVALRNFIELYGKPEKIIYRVNQRGQPDGNAASILANKAADWGIGTVSLPSNQGQGVARFDENLWNQLKIPEILKGYKKLLGELDAALGLNEGVSWSLLHKRKPTKRKREITDFEQTEAAEEGDFSFEINKVWPSGGVVSEEEKAGRLQIHPRGEVVVSAGGVSGASSPRRTISTQVEIEEEFEGSPHWVGKDKSRGGSHLSALDDNKSLVHLLKVATERSPIEKEEMEALIISKTTAPLSDHERIANAIEYTLNIEKGYELRDNWRSRKELVGNISEIARAYDQARESYAERYVEQHEIILNSESYQGTKGSPPRAVLVLGHEGQYREGSIGRGKSESARHANIKTLDLSNRWLRAPLLAELAELKAKRQEIMDSGFLVETGDALRQDPETPHEPETEALLLSQIADIDSRLEELYEKLGTERPGVDVDNTAGYYWPEKLALIRKMRGVSGTQRVVLSKEPAPEPLRKKRPIPTWRPGQEPLPEIVQEEVVEPQAQLEQSRENLEQAKKDTPLTELPLEIPREVEILGPTKSSTATQDIVSTIRRLDKTIQELQSLDINKRDNETDDQYRERLRKALENQEIVRRKIRIAKFDRSRNLIDLFYNQLENLHALFYGSPGVQANLIARRNAATRLGFIREGVPADEGLQIFGDWFSHMQQKVESARDVYHQFERRVSGLVEAELRKSELSGEELADMRLRLAKLRSDEGKQDEIPRAAVFNPNDIIKISKLVHPASDTRYPSKYAQVSSDAVFDMLAVATQTVWNSRHGVDTGTALADSKTKAALDRFNEKQKNASEKGVKDPDVEDSDILDLLEAKNISLRDKHISGTFFPDMKLGFESEPFVRLLRDLTGAENWATATNAQKRLMFSKLLHLPTYDFDEGVYLPNLYDGVRLNPYKEAIVQAVGDSPSETLGELQKEVTEMIERQGVDFYKPDFDSAFAQLMESEIVQEQLGHVNQVVDGDLLQKQKDETEAEYRERVRKAKKRFDERIKRLEEAAAVGFTGDKIPVTSIKIDASGQRVEVVEWVPKRFVDQRPLLVNGTKEEQSRGLVDKKTVQWISNDAPLKGGLSYFDEILKAEIAPRTIEHAYQAQKTLDPELRQKIYNARTAAGARKLGNSIVVGEEWEDRRVPIMLALLRNKFSQEPFKTLLRNEPRALIDNTGGFWATKVPELLTMIRTEQNKDLVPSTQGMVPQPVLAVFGGPLVFTKGDPADAQMKKRGGETAYDAVQAKKEIARRLSMNAAYRKGIDAASDKEIREYNTLTNELAKIAFRDSADRKDRIRGMLKNFISVNGMPRLVRLIGSPIGYFAKSPAYEGAVESGTTGGLRDGGDGDLQLRKGEVSQAWVEVLNEFNIAYEVFDTPGKGMDTEDMTPDQKRQLRQLLSILRDKNMLGIDNAGKEFDRALTKLLGYDPEQGELFVAKDEGALGDMESTLPDRPTHVFQEVYDITVDELDLRGQTPDVVERKAAKRRLQTRKGFPMQRGRLFVDAPMMARIRAEQALKTPEGQRALVNEWLVEKRKQKNIDTPLAMVYKEDPGSGLIMREEFTGQGLSAFDLVKTGNRIATTRQQKFRSSPTWKNLEEGDIVEIHDANGKPALIEVTRGWKNLATEWEQHVAKGGDPAELAEIWSKLEGWAPEVYDQYRRAGAWQFEYRYLGAPDVVITPGLVEDLPESAEAMSDSEMDSAIDEILKETGVVIPEDGREVGLEQIPPELSGDEGIGYDPEQGAIEAQTQQELEQYAFSTEVEDQGAEIGGYRFDTDLQLVGPEHQEGAGGKWSTIEDAYIPGEDIVGIRDLYFAPEPHAANVEYRQTVSGEPITRITKLRKEHGAIGGDINIGSGGLFARIESLIKKYLETNRGSNPALQLDAVNDEILDPETVEGETAVARAKFDLQIRDSMRQARERLNREGPVKEKSKIVLNPTMQARAVKDLGEEYSTQAGLELFQEFPEGSSRLEKFNALRKLVNTRQPYALDELEFASNYHDVLRQIPWDAISMDQLESLSAEIVGATSGSGIPSVQSLERGVLSVSREEERGTMSTTRQRGVLVRGDPANTSSVLKNHRREIKTRFRLAEAKVDEMLDRIGLSEELKREYVADIDSVWQLNDEVAIRGEAHPSDVAAVYDRLGGRIIINLSAVDPSNHLSTEAIMKESAFHEGVHHLYFTNRLTDDEERIITNYASNEKVSKDFDRGASEKGLTYLERKAIDPKYADLAPQELRMEAAIDVLFGLASGRIPPSKSAGAVGSIKNNLKSFINSFLVPAKESQLAPINVVLSRIMDGVVGGRDAGYVPGVDASGEVQGSLFSRYANPEQLRKLKSALGSKEIASSDAERQRFQEEADKISAEIVLTQEEVQKTLPDLTDEDDAANEEQATAINDNNMWFAVPEINKLNETSVPDTAEGRLAYRVALDEYMKMRNNPSYQGYKMPRDFALMAEAQTELPPHLVRRIDKAYEDGILVKPTESSDKQRIRGTGEYFDGESAPETLSSALNYRAKFRENYIDRYQRATQVEEEVVKREGGAYAEAETSMLLALRWHSNTLNMMPGLLQKGPISYVGMGATEGIFENRPQYDDTLISKDNPSGLIPGLQQIFDILPNTIDREGAHLYGIAMRIKQGRDKVTALEQMALREPFGAKRDLINEELAKAKFDYDRLNPEARGKRKYDDKFISETLAEFGKVDIILEFWKHHMAFNNAMIRAARDAELITEETYNEWKDRTHTPFYSDVGEVEASPFGTSSGLARKGLNKIEKALEGSFSPIVGDMYENMETSFKALVRDMTQNVALSRLSRDVLKLGEGRKMEYGDVIRMKDDSRIVRVMENGRPVFYEFADPELAKSVMISGVNAREAISQMFGGSKLGEGVSKAFMGMAQVLRESVTRTPPYMIRNIMRDAGAADVALGGGPPLIFAALKNAFDHTSLDRAARLHLAIGLDTMSSGYGEDMWMGRYRSGIKKLNWKNPLSGFAAVWQGLGRMASQSEVAVRLAIYDRVFAATGNKALAQGMALELLNFGRRGANPMFRVWLGTVPFMNGRIQGLDMLWRTGISSHMDAPDMTVLSQPPQNQREAMEEGQALRVWRRRRKMVFNRGLQLAALSSLYYLLTRDEEEYQAQRPEIRADNWLVPLTKSVWLKIPIWFEVGVIFKVLPEELTKLVLSGAGAEIERGYSLGDVGEQMYRQARNTLNFGAPQLLAPFMDAARNRDRYRGDFIVDPLTNQMIEPIEQRNDFTSNTATMFAHVMDTIPLVGDLTGLNSPEKASYFIRQAGGAWATYITTVMDRLIRMHPNSILPFGEAQNVVGTRYDFDFESLIGGPGLTNVPLLGDMLLDPEKGDANTQLLFEKLRELDQKIATWGRVSERDWLEGLKYEDKNRQWFAFSEELRSLERQMAALYSEREWLAKRRDLSNEEKREMWGRMKIMEKRITSRMDKLNYALKKPKKRAARV